MAQTINHRASSFTSVKIWQWDRRRVDSGGGTGHYPSQEVRFMKLGEHKANPTSETSFLRITFLILGAVAAIDMGGIRNTFAESVQLDNVPHSSGIDNGLVSLMHNFVGQEGGGDGDSTSFPPMVNPQALRAWTNPYSTNLLSLDNRPTNSFTPYFVYLVVKDNLGTGVSTSNHLEFKINVALGCAWKDYQIDVAIWGNGSSNSPYFSKTYGLQDLVSNSSSRTDTWGLTNLANNTQYGRVVMTPLTRIYNSFTVSIEGGENFGVSPTNFAVMSGDSGSAGVANIYYTNAAGARRKFAGFEKVQ